MKTTKKVKVLILFPLLVFSVFFLLILFVFSREATSPAKLMTSFCYSTSYALAIGAVIGGVVFGAPLLEKKKIKTMLLSLLFFCLLFIAQAALGYLLTKGRPNPFVKSATEISSETIETHKAFEHVAPVL